MYKDAQKYLNTLRPMEGNSLKSVLTWLMWIKFHEIYIQYSDAKWNSMLRLQVIITETVRVQVHTKEQ